MNKQKQEIIEKAATDFKKLDEANKMLIIGYMMGVQTERERWEKEPRSA